MCSTHWPAHVDMRRDDAKRLLRRLELEAYASLVSALRARGDLTPEKKKILQDLQQTLSISTERHRAEVRRAVNDEKLSTIAQHMNTHHSDAEWLVEGRRLVPLMPRLVPQTAFTPTADNAAISQAEKNLSLPSPALTGKDIYAPPPPSTPSSTAVQQQRPQSPPNNVVVLPSGMSIHIKGGLSTEEEETHTQTKRRRRSSSADSLIITKTTSPVISVTGPKLPVPPGYMASLSPPGPTPPPVRVTVAKSPGKLHLQSSQKVVVVSSAASATPTASSSLPNILHRPYMRPVSQLSPRPPVASQTTPAMSSPYRASDTRDPQPPAQAASSLPAAAPHIVQTTTTPRTMPATSETTQYPRTVAATSTVASPYPRTGVVTSQYPRPVATTSVTSQYQRPVSVTTNVTSGVGMKLLDHIVSLTTTASAMTSQQGTIIGPQVLSTVGHRGYPRTRTIITRPRVPLTPGHRSTIVIPPSGQAIQSPQIYRTAKSNVHIKQEGSMKIITQAVGGSSAKILPKPSSSGVSRLPGDGSSAHTGSTVVVVTTVPSSVTMAARSSLTTAGGKIVSMGGARVINTSGSKHVQITAVKTSHPGASVLPPSGGRVVSSGSGKPNVIVVQKGAPTRKLLTSLGQPGMSQSQGNTSQTVITPKSPPVVTQLQSGFEKDYISFIEKQGTQPCFSQGARPIVTQQQKVERRLAPRLETLANPAQPQKMTVIRQKADGTSTSQPMVITASHVNKPSILTELIGSRTSSRDQRGIERIEILSEDSQAAAAISGTGQKEGMMVQNQWVEMDAPLEQARDTGDSSAIRALLDLQQGGKVRQKDDAGQVVEQVVEETVDGAQYIKTDQGTIKLNASQSGGIFTDTGQPVQIEIASEEELNQIANTAVSQEIIGELDPNTGILYTSQMLDGQQVIASDEISSITPLRRAGDRQTDGVTYPDAIPSVPEGTLAGKKVLQQQIISQGVTERHVLRDDTARDDVTHDVPSSDDDVIVVPSRDVTPSSQASDFLSSALNQAQIDLQPYQLMEEDEPAQKAANQEADDSRSLIQTDEGDLSFSTASETETVEMQTGSEPVSVTRQPKTIKPVLSTLPVSVGREAETSRIDPTAVRVAAASAEGAASVVQSSVPSASSQAHAEETHLRGGFPQQQYPQPQQVEEVVGEEGEGEGVISGRSGEEESVSEATAEGTDTDAMDVSGESCVRMETAGIDPLAMSDLSSQQMETNPDYVTQPATSYIPEVAGGPGHFEESAKRKRKPPARADDAESHVTAWARQALILLQKVSRYRGMYKQKGDLPAASWFTQPVDPAEVPDYYTIVARPMDFSTIKRKLEAGEYGSWEDFHDDMLLVRDNCYAYNPHGSDVRHDCDDVFTFYAQEYEKALQRWMQGTSRVLAHST